MKVDITDLGFVKHAHLDLDKDLTILCGPNNTGKTYVAYAIYGLMKFRSHLPKSKKISNELKSLLEKGQIELDILDLLLKNNETYLNAIGDSYVSQIHKVFASDEKAFSKTKIGIEIGNIEDLKRKILAEEISQEIGIRNSVSVKIFKKSESQKITCLLIEKDDKEVSDKQAVPTSILLDFLADRIFSILIDFIFPKTYIAPAERIAINIFSKELSLKRNVLVDKLLELKEVGKDDDPFDLVKRRATRYPLPIRDSLETSEDLINFKKNTSDFAHFADEIEKEILKGQVLISKDGEVQYKPDKAKSLKLPIHLSASVVKSLSNLVIYFRHLAAKGDFIIIDEPELNLHPDNQVVIAKVIIKIVNRGFKVLISTHSDYIIREINNLIMMNNNPHFINKYNYSNEITINHERVGAILFHYEKRKCTNLEVTKTGFEVETIDKVINDLNNRAEDLFFNLESQ
ncbi:AAA family ATPase [Belliella kenyensis]|uniref:AAA family ATPase n=1 Tax=Belliella kenyensis TaxID=1472724 RepID=A0ABV8EHZ9_9BACT|nr:AAA family ATPase [Belliella kenyensis]MCH7401137.1 ATP-binding protein [Belliella kenyensis]MDN3604134.1 AAA family ATPase [Belliella kenyensis]